MMTAIRLLSQFSWATEDRKYLHFLPSKWSFAWKQETWETRAKHFIGISITYTVLQNYAHIASETISRKT